MTVDWSYFVLYIVFTDVVKKKRLLSDMNGLSGCYRHEIKFLSKSLIMIMKSRMNRLR